MLNASFHKTTVIGQLYLYIVLKPFVDDHKRSIIVEIITCKIHHLGRTYTIYLHLWWQITDHLNNIHKFILTSDG